jgi:hypothetical protein
MKKPPTAHIESLDGNIYRVSSDYSVNFGDWLEPLHFKITAGFTTDLASVPSLFRSLLDRAGLGIVAPLVHDYICGNRGKLLLNSGKEIQVSWTDCNLLFFLLMRIDGVPWPKAFVAFLAVMAGSPRW